MTRSISLTRRLVISVLLLELFSAAALIAAIVVHERHTQYAAFDSMLEGTARAMLGSVQETNDVGDNVMLDLRGVRTGRNAVYRVEESNGRILGAAGEAPYLEGFSSSDSLYRNVTIAGRGYRFLLLHGIRIVDPGERGGVRHEINIVYGQPVGHIWHEILEAVRFFALATILLLGFTAAAMAWLVRKGLEPLRALAQEASLITSTSWTFNAPASARNTIELQPLTAALEAALGRLQRSFEQQRRFTSDAAHELKTDVAIVKSSLQLLSMRRRTAEEYGQGLALSLEDFTRLEMTVQHMLTLARLEQSPEPLPDTHSPSSSLGEVLDEAIHVSTPFAALRSVSIRFEDSHDATIPIDRRDALLLCSNILINALQHSPAGSEVVITFEVRDDQGKLTVTDRGEGISEADRPFLFDPFYRGDASRSRKSGGTGLGLSICKAICVRVEGSIDIANNSSGGATVTVTLPAVSAVAEPVLSAWVKP